MSEEIAAILERAEKRLVKGWGQCGQIGTYDSRYRPCIGVAIERSAGSGRNAPKRIRTALASLGLGDLGSIMRWNDDPTRTKEQVLAKLREAAAKARAGQ